MTTVTLGVPESKVRVIAPDVGGGFGGKIGVLPEEMLCVALAQKLGQAGQVDRDPLGVAAGRAPRPGPDPGHHDRRQAGRHGHRRWTSSCSPTWAPTSGLVGPGVPILGAFMFNAIYKFPAYRFACTNVFTNKTLTDAYRGAGRPEATFAVERIMDELAVELGRDPMELRQQNWITHEEFPFTTVCGLTYDTGNYEQATQQAHGDLRLRRAAPRAGAAPGSRATRSSWASASRRSPRCAGWPRPGCSARCPTAPAAGRRPASGCWPPARSR